MIRKRRSLLSAYISAVLLTTCSNCHGFTHPATTLVVGVHSSLCPATTLCISKRHVMLYARAEQPSSYVPDGLTEEEYQKIKQQEAEELSQKDFGAFGPNFRRSATPEGDWFLMRSLWTAGFNSNESVESNASLSRKSRVAAFVRTYGPAYVLAYCAIESLFSAVFVTRVPQSSVFSALKVAFPVSRLGDARDFFVTAAQLGWIKAISATLGSWRVREFVGLCISRNILWKHAGASLLTWPAYKYVVEHFNRKRLWSTRRTVMSSMGLLATVLCIWSASVTQLKPFLGY